MSRIVTALVVVFAFGPYLAGGLRTEQVFVYGIFVAAMPLVASRRFALRGPLLALAGVWAVYACVALIGAAWQPQNRSGFPGGSIVAGADNVIYPIIVLIVGGMLASSEVTDARRLLRTAASTAVALMSLNTVAGVAQSRGADWSAWWTTDPNASVALNAASNGRFSGLINQPAEGGLLYGIAVLCAIYLFRERPARLAVAAVFLLYGGAMTVSKVFLLVALPLAAWQLLRARERRASRVVLLSLGGVGFWLAVRVGLVPEWAGGEQLRQLLPGASESFVSSATADRFGSDSSMTPAIHAALGSDPLFGFGAGGLRIAYDNGWVEALVVAGLVGAVCYTAALVLLGLSWSRLPRSPERTLLGGLVLLATGASLGLPAFTANRAATVFWLLVALACAAGEQRRECSDVERDDGAESADVCRDPARDREVSGVGDRAEAGRSL